MPKVSLGTHWEHRSNDRLHKVSFLKPEDYDDDQDYRRNDAERSLDLSPIRSSRKPSRAGQFDSPTCHPVWLKILLLGDSGTGKSAITEKLIHKRFDLSYNPTLSVDINSFGIDVGMVKVHVNLCNLVETEKGTQHVNDNHFQGAHGAFIVGDITQPLSIDHLMQWRALIDAKIEMTESPPLAVMFLANKIDMIEEENVSFSKSKVDHACRAYNIKRWYATSAKDGVNLNLAIKQMVLDILKGPYSSYFQAIPVRDLTSFEQHVKELRKKDTTASLTRCDPASPRKSKTNWKLKSKKNQNDTPDEESSDITPTETDTNVVKTECSCAIS